MNPRYVVLGLGGARSAWLSNVAAWATAGAIPVEFSKCLSPAEVAQRLSSLRRHSAVLLELLDDVILKAAREAGVPVILVTDKPVAPPGIITLSAVAGPADLLATLAAHAEVVATAETMNLTVFDDVQTGTGSMYALCGAGGTGVSTLAMALAQTLASDIVNTDLVVLADFAPNAEQGMLHDAPDIVPGTEELVDLHRSARASISEVRSLTFAVPDRGYQLLLGIRRSSAWTSMPLHSIQASLGGLRRSYRHTVADIRADFEGEAQSGSRDIEERNALSRLTALQADVIFVVGQPTLKGVHGAGRTVRELLDLGVSADRIQPVMNRTPKRFTEGRQVRKALSAITTPKISEPVFLKEHRVEAALQDCAPLPAALGSALAVRCGLTTPSFSPTLVDPQRINPGSLGVSGEAVGQ